MANVEYKCPACGGALKFDSSLQKVVCQYCDSEFEVEDLKNYNEDLQEDKEEDTTWDESQIHEFSEDEKNGLQVFTCNSCGGELLCDQNTSSTSCPYCGNPVLVASRLTGALKPNFVIPFKKDKNEAIEGLNKHYKGKVLLPSSFKKQNAIEEIKSIYVPFWIFDADVDAKIRYRTTKIRRWSTPDYTYTETRHYSVVRGGNIGFDHIPVDGSRKMDDKLMESIEPFDFKEVVPFDGAYLAGYAADKYDVSKEETFNRATTRIKQGTEVAFRKTVRGYDTVSEAEANIRFLDSKANYALYPIWILNTKYKDKNYQFALNAQTGKMAGNLPVSSLRFTLFMLLFFVLFAVPSALITYFAEEDEQWLMPIVVGLGVGAIFTALIMYLLYKKNKNVNFSYGASDYVRENSMHINISKDIFLYKTVRRVKKPTNNNNRK